MLKFVYRCLNSQSLIVNFIVRHSILFSRMNSTIGRNVLSCSQRYHTSISSIISCNFSINNIERAASVVSEDVCDKIRDVVSVSVSRPDFEMSRSRLVNFVGTSRLGLVSNIKSNVSVSSRSRT